MAVVLPDPLAPPSWPVSQGTAPTIDGFVFWMTYVMGVPTTVWPPFATDAPLPPPYAPSIQYAFDEALNIAYWGLACLPGQPTSPSIYAVAVYNLAGDIMARTAQDQSGAVPPTFWADLRASLGLGSFNPGLITASADQGTSEASVIPNQLKDMTLGNLLLMQTPWGRAYLGIISSWGTLWGIS